MKNLFVISLLVTGFAVASGCSKEQAAPPTPPAKIMTISGTLSGASVLPAPVNSPGTGTVTGTLNMDTNEFAYTITYAGLSALPTRGHFHVGTPPSNVGPVYAATISITASPITSKTILLAANRDALVAGNVYVNVHTQAHSDGELRANLVAR